jgi:ABC-type transport system involved in multi-copper enzyme maturation permease subunit
VARYTLLELSRRRILLVFFVIGALGIAALGVGLKVFSSSFASGISFGGPSGSAPDPAKINRFLELSYVNNLIGALGLFSLLIAFAIGMTVIYHDLESGSAVAIFSKPLSRFAFAVGKFTAAVAAMIAIVGVLSLEARLLMLLFGNTGIEGALWVQTIAQVANAITLMLLVMALSTWMNNIVAAIVAFIYNAVAGVAVALYDQMQTGSFGNNAVLHAGLTALYWLVPHPLMSDAARQIARAQYELFSTPENQGGPPIDQVLGGIPGASGAGDITWWVFVLVVFAGLVYYAVRRRQV